MRAVAQFHLQHRGQDGAQGHAGSARRLRADGVVVVVVGRALLGLLGVKVGGQGGSRGQQQPRPRGPPAGRRVIVVVVVILGNRSARGLARAPVDGWVGIPRRTAARSD